MIRLTLLLGPNIFPQFLPTLFRPLVAPSRRASSFGTTCSPPNPPFHLGHWQCRDLTSWNRPRHTWTLSTITSSVTAIEQLGEVKGHFKHTLVEVKRQYFSFLAFLFFKHTFALSHHNFTIFLLIWPKMIILFPQFTYFILLFKRFVAAMTHDFDREMLESLEGTEGG